MRQILAHLDELTHADHLEQSDGYAVVNFGHFSGFPTKFDRDIVRRRLSDGYDREVVVLVQPGNAPEPGDQLFKAWDEEDGLACWGLLRFSGVLEL